jgi:hypothetical protein
MFGRTFDLAVQINADGFHIAVDGKRKVHTASIYDI